jgi:hypothetical protein
MSFCRVKLSSHDQTLVALVVRRVRKSPLMRMIGRELHTRVSKGGTRKKKKIHIKREIKTVPSSLSVESTFILLPSFLFTHARCWDWSKGGKGVGWKGCYKSFRYAGASFEVDHSKLLFIMPKSHVAYFFNDCSNLLRYAFRARRRHQEC